MERERFRGRGYPRLKLSDRKEDPGGRRIDRRPAGGVAGNDIDFFCALLPKLKAGASAAGAAVHGRAREGSPGIRISSAFHVTQEDGHEGERGRRWRRRRELYECYVEEMRRRGRKGRPRPDGRTACMQRLPACGLYAERG